MFFNKQRKTFLSLIFIILPILANAETDLFKVNKVAVVDIQSVFDQSMAISYIKKSLEDLNTAVQQELSQKEMELKRKEKALIEIKDTLNEDEFNKRATQFNKEVTEVQQIIQTKKIKLEQSHNNSMNRVYSEMKGIIDILAKKYNLNLVITSSYVLYNQPELDITKEVIAILNNQVKKVDIDY